MQKTSSTLLLIFLFLGYGAFPQTKLALVIGNSEYEFLESLKNAKNDATDVSRLLEEMGFEVDFHINTSKEELKEAVRNFGQRAKNYDILLFYYAGHGIEIFGKNYFVPIGALATSATEVRKTCVSASAITQYMKLAKSEANIVILDACRSNPFTLLSSDEASDGLALMDAPPGTIISFATAPGRVAFDGVAGDARNGAYTDALLNHLGTYDLSINEVFARVRNTVVAQTNEKQIPWESTSLSGELILRPKPELPIQVNILEGDSVTFEGDGELHAVSNLKGVSFYWYFNGHQYLNKATVPVNKTGKYEVKGISQAGQVLVSKPIKVTVQSFVEPQLFILEGREVAFKEDGMLHGRANVLGEYRWFKENNYIGDGPDMQVSLSGRYTFQIITRDGVKAVSEPINVKVKK